MKYKGTIKFISEAQNLALVEETYVTENLAITDSNIGTGDGSIVTFSGTLQPIIEEGSFVLKVAGAPQTAADYSLETALGRQIMTSTGMGTIVQGGFMTAVGLVTSTGNSVLFGSSLTTSTGAVNVLGYLNGAILLSFTAGAKPTAGQAVTVSYERGATSQFSNGIKLLRGDFTGLAVDSVIYYEYTGGSVEVDSITTERSGQ